MALSTINGSSVWNVYGRPKLHPKILRKMAIKRMINMEIFLNKEFYLKPQQIITFSTFLGKFCNYSQPSSRIPVLLPSLDSTTSFT